MTTVTPSETAAPRYSTYVTSTNARSNLNDLARQSVAKVPFAGALPDSSVLRTLLRATSVTGALLDTRALTLHLVKFHGQVRSALESTGTFEIDDLRPLLNGTSFITINYDNVLADPFRSTDTRMSELRVLAHGLSLRQWAELFAVSKQTIRNWMASEPPSRPELDAALRALRTAADRQPHLGSWLQAQLPGSARTPLDLAKEGRWRALSAASRMTAPVGLGTPPTAEMREVARERRAVSKRLGGADAPPAGDEED